MNSISPNSLLNYYESDPFIKERHPLTFLFIHGAESSLETWKPVTEALQERYHLIAIDLRGHGGSSIGDPERDFTVEQFTDDIHAVVKDRKLKKVILVAHSMGSRLAISYAVKHPEHIAGLVIEDMELIPRPPQIKEKQDIEELRQFQTFHPTLDDVKAELKKYHFEKFDSWFKQGRIKWVDQEKKFFIGVHPYVSYLMHNLWLASDVALQAFKLIKEKEFPVLLLKAEKESSISAEGLRQMKSYLPSIQVREIKDSDHRIHKTNTLLFIHELLTFCQ